MTQLLKSSLELRNQRLKQRSAQVNSFEFVNLLLAALIEISLIKEGNL